MRAVHRQRNEDPSQFYVPKRAHWKASDEENIFTRTFRDTRESLNVRCANVLSSSW
jgi:hypothetical protein